MTAVVALSALLAVRLLPEGEGEAVTWRDLSSQVGPLTILRSERRLFRERSALETYLSAARAERSAPAVDFNMKITSEN